MALFPAWPRVVDDVTVRLVAGEVLVMVVAAFALRDPRVFGLLAVDFVARSALGPRWSPLARLAAVVRPHVRIPPRPTAGPPKRFAATMGAVFTIAIPVLAAVDQGLIAWSLTVLMLVFPILEAGFGICVGCLAFSLLIRLGIVPERVCVECANISLRVRPAGTHRPAA